MTTKLLDACRIERIDLYSSHEPRTKTGFGFNSVQSLHACRLIRSRDITINVHAGFMLACVSLTQDLHRHRKRASHSFPK